MFPKVACNELKSLHADNHDVLVYLRGFPLG